MPFRNASSKLHGTRRRPMTAGRILIRLALLMGLLNFPAMSASGAELSHPHSLFMLGHHHHDHDGETKFTSDHHDADNSGMSQSFGVSSNGGPMMQGPAEEFVGGNPIGLTLSSSLSAELLGVTISPSLALFQLPTGESGKPEIPPPRG